MPEVLFGKRFFTVSEASSLCGRTQKAVRCLVFKKKIQTVPQFDRRVIIPASEVAKLCGYTPDMVAPPRIELGSRV